MGGDSKVHGQECTTPHCMSWALASGLAGLQALLSYRCTLGYCLVEMSRDGQASGSPGRLRKEECMVGPLVGTENRVTYGACQLCGRWMSCLCFAP